jgi:hypothetical protein
MRTTFQTALILNKPLFKVNLNRYTKIVFKGSIGSTILTLLYDSATVYILNSRDSCWYRGHCAGWMTEELGFDFLQGQEVFLFSTASIPALGPTQPPIQWVLRAVSLGVKRPGREANHSLPSSAEVKNGGAILPLLHMFSWRDA